MYQLSADWHENRDRIKDQRNAIKHSGRDTYKLISPHTYIEFHTVTLNFSSVLKVVLDCAAFSDHVLLYIF